MLGPMVNPFQNQLVGVFNLELARMYAYFCIRIRQQMILYIP
jgi:anthranilate phosphoribosyltransferase